MGARTSITTQPMIMRKFIDHVASEPEVAIQTATESATTEKFSFPMNADSYNDVGQSKHTIQFIAHETRDVSQYFNLDNIDTNIQRLSEEIKDRWGNSYFLETRDFTLERLNRIYLKKPEAIFTFYMPSPIIFHQGNEYEDISLLQIGNQTIGNALGYKEVIDTEKNSALESAAQYMGYSLNPVIEILYQATSLRKFEFEFRLSPTSEAEAIMLEKMIRKLRAVSSPERQFVGGIFFKAPDTFDIRFMHNGIENTKIPKIHECVLESLEVDYTSASGDLWSTFRTGHPVSTRLRMEFKEKEIIDRYNVEKGF